MLERMEDKQRPSFLRIGFSTKLRSATSAESMPSLQLTYADGTTELLPLPVEIWANNEPVGKGHCQPRPIQQIRFGDT